MMKKIIRILLISAVVFTFAACKKEYNVGTNLANINILHAIVNVPTLIVNTSGKKGVWNLLSAPTANTSKVNYGFGLGNTFTAGIPSALTIVSSADTLRPLYQASGFMPQPGELYTLFLAGRADAVEPVLIKEQLVPRADSATGVRFVNLVSNSGPISVNIRNIATPEVAGLSYKQVSDFKVYDAHKVNSSYVFEMRDASNALLASFTYTVARTFNVTLVLRGLIGGAAPNAPTITKLNHY
jgi:hypothetical protein